MPGKLRTFTDGKTTSDPDKFRIKITEVGGGVVYDNNMGSLEAADPATVLRGGNIVVHKE